MLSNPKKEADMINVVFFSRLLVLSVLKRLGYVSTSTLSSALEKATDGGKIPFWMPEHLSEFLEREAESDRVRIKLSTDDYLVSLTRTGQKLVTEEEEEVINYFPGLRSVRRR